MTVLVGYTRTPEGEAALERAIAEARLRDTRLVLVHSRKSGDDRDVDEIVMYNERLEEIDKRLAKGDVAHTIHDFIRGNEAAEDIVNTAADEDAELIVIGHRPRSRTGKYLLGSTLQDVIMDAHCPVMTVPEQPGSAEEGVAG